MNRSFNLHADHLGALTIPFVSYLIRVSSLDDDVRTPKRHEFARPQNSRFQFNPFKFILLILTFSLSGFSLGMPQN